MTTINPIRGLIGEMDTDALRRCPGVWTVFQSAKRRSNGMSCNQTGNRVAAKRGSSRPEPLGRIPRNCAIRTSPHEPRRGFEPNKFFGPHLGLAYGRRELIESWRPYKVRPAADEPVGHRYELGTLPHELLAGFVAAVDYVASLGWDAVRAHERALGELFLGGIPDGVELYGLETMEGRVPTFCFNIPGHSPEGVASFLADRDLAVWHGNYYALETMRYLGLPDGAVRAGIVHYNTENEVDRLLAALGELVSS